MSWTSLETQATGCRRPARGRKGKGRQAGGGGRGKSQLKLGEEKVSGFYKKHTAQPELSTSKE